MRTLLIVPLLWIFAAPGLAGPGPDSDIKTLETRITELETFIDQYPKHKDLEDKRIELADRCFLLNRAMVRCKVQTGAEYLDPENSRAAKYLQKSVNLYRQVLSNRPQVYESKARGKARESLRRERALLGLKTGICIYFSKELYRGNDKEIKNALRMAASILSDVSWDAPSNDPICLWAWLFKSLAYLETGDEDQALLLAAAVLDPAFLDWKKTVSAGKGDKNLITIPLEAIALWLVRQYNARGEYPLSIEKALPLLKAMASVKEKDRSLHALLATELARAYTRSGEDRDAGPLLNQALFLTEAVEAQHLALPLLKAWLDRREGEMNDKYEDGDDTYYEALVALGVAHQSKGNYALALGYYEMFIQSFVSSLTEKKYATRVRENMDLCRAALQEGESAGEKIVKETSPCFPPLGIFAELGSFTGKRAVLRPKSIPESPVVSKENRKLWTGMVADGVTWLATHQDPEGYWDCDGFSSTCKRPACTGKGGPLNDAGSTALAVLSLMRAGNSLYDGKYREETANGLRYLCDIQDLEDGCLVIKEGLHYMYNHGTAGLAVIEAYRASRWPDLRMAAEGALDYIHQSKNRGKAWRYNDGAVDPVEQNDVSVTGWMVRCLCSAHGAGIPIDENDLHEAMNYIEELTDQETFRTGYKQPGTFGARELGDDELWPADLVEAITGVAMVSRLCSGEVLDNAEFHLQRLEGASLLLQEKPPLWGVGEYDLDQTDLYYWYYGTKAMVKMGGEGWIMWRKAVLAALKEGQCSKNCAKGSWPPEADPWGDNGGRIYSTAMGVLTLEAICLE